MAEEISDGQFKAEMLEFKTEMSQFKTDVMRFVDTAGKKFDGLTADIRTNAFKLDRLENGLNQVAEKLDGVASDVKVLSGQFTDVAGMVIRDHHPRIERIEERIDVLESGTH